MGMKELIAKQYDYGCWVRDKLLHEARRLSDEQYFADPAFGGLRSVHASLLHAVSTEWLWRNLAHNGALPGPPPNAEDFATLASIEAAWQEEEAAYRAFLDSLSEADLEVEINTVSPAGSGVHVLALGNATARSPAFHAASHRDGRRVDQPRTFTRRSRFHLLHDRSGVGAQ